MRGDVVRGTVETFKQLVLRATNRQVKRDWHTVKEKVRDDDEQNCLAMPLVERFGCVRRKDERDQYSDETESFEHGLEYDWGWGT